MPELPDITAYLGALRPRIIGQVLERVRVVSPFLLRTADPPIDAAEGRAVVDVRRLAKRIVLCLSDDLYLVFHLMIAGRFRWLPSGAKPPAKIGLAAFAFPSGTLVLTEASKKKRAALHFLAGQAALHALDPGGLDPLEISERVFRERLLHENHTLKRALTDPRLFSGIGNAYSDEILHAARLSPIKLTSRLTSAETTRLFRATRETLQHWIDILCERFAERFPGPGDITAFRKEFSVHGRFGQPCPACDTTVQRIRYAENETNYCPRCQTAGRVLADRSLSRLLKGDWPRTIEELETS